MSHSLRASAESRVSLKRHTHTQIQIQERKSASVVEYSLASANQRRGVTSGVHYAYFIRNESVVVFMGHEVIDTPL